MNKHLMILVAVGILFAGIAIAEDAITTKFVTVSVPVEDKEALVSSGVEGLDISDLNDKGEFVIGNRMYSVATSKDVCTDKLVEYEYTENEEVKLGTKTETTCVKETLSDADIIKNRDNKIKEVLQEIKPKVIAPSEDRVISTGGKLKIE